MSRRVTVGQAFQEGVREEMLANDRIFVIGTDLFRRGGHFAQVKGIGDEFGRERVLDAPISEAAIVAAGVGAAMRGMRPIVDLNFIDFAFGAMDEIVNQAAKMRYMSGASVPLVIRASNGVAGYASQHNNSIEDWFAETPGLLVVAPSTPADTKGLIKSALRADDPVVFLMHKRLSGARGEVGDADTVVPIGRADVRRSGRDVSLFAYGINVSKALAAADLLAREGIEADVVDLRTLFPLDVETIEASVRRTGRAVVVTEAPRVGGMAAQVAAHIQEEVFDWLDAPVLRVGAGHAPIPHSPVLMEALIPQPEGIAAAVRASVAKWPTTDPADLSGQPR